MYIIDFDDTLFNTQLFKQKRKEAIVSLGISPEDYELSYIQGYVTEQGEYCYSNQSHATALAALGHNFDDVYQALQVTTISKNLQSYLFDDTIFFLEYLKNKNKKLILLSLGAHSFQQLKSQGSGVLGFFDDIFFVQKKKEEVILEILNKHQYDDIWFINDKIEETTTIVEKHKNIKAVIKNKSDLKEINGIPIRQSLKEVIDYIEHK